MLWENSLGVVVCREVRADDLGHGMPRGILRCWPERDITILSREDVEQ